MSDSVIEGSNSSTRRVLMALPLVLLVGAVGAWLGWRAPAQRWPLTPATNASPATAEATPASAPAPTSAPGVRKAAAPKPARTNGGASAFTAAAVRPGAPPVLEGWPLWEFQLKQPLPPREPPLTPPNWRLVGASNDGKAWQLIVLRQGEVQPVFYKVGDNLPGGFLIEKITEEEVTLKQRTRRLVLSYIG